MAAEPLYIVMGTTGEYSDCSEWAVVAYRDEAIARRHCELATARAAEIEAKIKTLKGGWYSDEAAILLRTNQWDPDLRLDYPGTTYFVVKTWLSNASEPQEVAPWPDEIERHVEALLSGREDLLKRLEAAEHKNTDAEMTIIRLRQRAEAGEARLARAKEALREIAGCFDAAYAEGLQESLAGLPWADSLRDLVERRLLPAHQVALSTLDQEPEQHGQ